MSQSNLSPLEVLVEELIKSTEGYSESLVWTPWDGLVSAPASSIREIDRCLTIQVTAKEWAEVRAIKAALTDPGQIVFVYFFLLLSFFYLVVKYFLTFLAEPQYCSCYSQWDIEEMVWDWAAHGTSTINLNFQKLLNRLSIVIQSVCIKGWSLTVFKNHKEPKAAHFHCDCFRTLWAITDSLFFVVGSRY